MQPLLPKLPGQTSDVRLMSDWMERKRSAPRWLGGVFAGNSMNTVEGLGATVVRFDVVVGDRPRGCRTFSRIVSRCKVLATQTQEHRGIELGRSSDEIETVRAIGLTVPG